MKLSLIALFFIVCIQSALCSDLLIPERGVFGAYVDAGPHADNLTQDNILEFEQTIGHQLAWIYFSNNWFNGEISFPRDNISLLRKLGRVPYIRLMPWSEARSTGADDLFTLDAFLEGKFDTGLRVWAREALQFPGEYILEFGPEMNGNWFSWSGSYNGRGETEGYGDPFLPDGPEKFADVFKRIVSIFREEGLNENVKWVLHLDSAPVPHAWWNNAEYYYPGSEYVDWIGLSVFGAQLPTHQWISFETKFRRFWPEIRNLVQSHPLVISEFAVIEKKNDSQAKAKWLRDAFTFMQNGDFEIAGATYWNSPGWLPEAKADFRLTSSKNSLEAIIEILNDEFWKDLGVKYVDL